MKPRYISPHPYTNQDIIALARGPIVYCVEDVDNPWVNDHFKSLCLETDGRISENPVAAPEMAEPCVGLTVHNAASFLEVDHDTASVVSPRSVTHVERPDVEELHFIPYALRDNRGGRGQMRVGIRRKS
jgi:uncharacterized protein